MARSGRFELPTPRFVVWCSIQLSYERVADEGCPRGVYLILSLPECKRTRRKIWRVDDNRREAAKSGYSPKRSIGTGWTGVGHST